MYSVGIGVVSRGLRFGCAARGRGGQASARSERARSRRPMAARGGGCSSNVRPLRELYATRRQAEFFSEAFAVPRRAGVWPRGAIGEPALRRRPRRRFVSRRERAEARARVAGTHRPNGPTAAINPDRPPLNAVSSSRLGLPITDSARFINSEIALFRGRQGAATHGGLLVGSWSTHEEITRLLEGGLVGHALGAKRVAVEPLDPSPGDRRVGAGASPRADRASTRRRARRPRAWGEARGRRTTQLLPLRSQTRAAA